MNQKKHFYLFAFVETDEQGRQVHDNIISGLDHSYVTMDDINAASRECGGNGVRWVRPT